MKRQALILILSILSTLSAQRSETSDAKLNSNNLNVKNCQIMTQFYEIWNESNFGREPNREERAVWIKQNDDGKYEFVKWGMAIERQEITWHGVIPEKIVAIAHTHPQKVDPRPSKEDGLVAERLKVPVYTISRKGIWKVTTQKTIVQEAGLKWYKDVTVCKDTDQEL
jgi:hypothetical protein